MEYRSVGNSGFKVSPLCFGTTLFGGLTDEAEADGSVIALGRENGVPTPALDTLFSFAKGIECEGNRKPLYRRAA